MASRPPGPDHHPPRGHRAGTRGLVRLVRSRVARPLRKVVARLARQASQLVGLRQEASWRTTRAEALALVELVRAELGTTSRATVVMLGRPSRRLVRELLTACPSWTVVEAGPAASMRLVRLTLLGPVDAIIDVPSKRGRLTRFRADFYQLRAGGVYVVPKAAGELGDAPGKLGRHLAKAASLPEQELRRGRRRGSEANHLLAIKMHVTPRASGEHLVLSHDLPDVLVKLDEPQTNAYLDAAELPHRVLSVLPAPEPPPLGAYHEGPVRRDPPVDGPIGPVELSVREYRDIVVDTQQLVMTDRVAVADSFRHHRRDLLTNRSLVDVAARFGVPRRPVEADLPLLRGTYLHLDNEIRGHFGHLLTESLSRVWTWPVALDLDADAKVLLGATRKRPEVAEWEYGFYEACGIPRDRIVTIAGQVRVERLIAGTPMFSMPEYVHPGIVDIWDEVGDRLAAQAKGRDWPRRFFVARKSRRRTCTNAEVVERIFAERGYAIVYPEDYPLGDQVALFRQAEVIGGWCGSGTFHLALVPDHKHLIRVGSVSYQPRNELLIGAVRGHRTDDVTCSDVEDGSNGAAFSFNVIREGPYLTGVLERAASG